jgi:hypothetical protein
VLTPELGDAAIASCPFSRTTDRSEVRSILSGTIEVGLALGGLCTAVALDGRESISEGHPRLLSYGMQRTALALAQACAVLARQIYLLNEGHRAEAARLQRESWRDQAARQTRLTCAYQGH